MFFIELIIILVFGTFVLGQSWIGKNGIMINRGFEIYRIYFKPYHHFFKF